MKTLAIGAIALLGASALTPALYAQDMSAPPPMEEPMPPPPAPPEVVQEQANPQGTGAPTEGVPDPATAQDPVPPAMPADPGYHAGPYKGALTPPPAEAMSKDYPVCTKKVQDSCRNRGGK
ncbi:hypothetical protein NT2_02_04090 [Caenibius tardaugens NBRC 16725]|uniref:Fe-S oxidoreductase n=1 Tax=Caenibius tardaugens NBRC 16725 TaxID=1219035 RepID=U2YJI1_9SPHN|nr:hypothetical protein [Caenibius tardaugens]AZI34805.1 hypothetical protein EGO55_01590 [Caenibius tardaugens NBRC 16725]TXH12362.1 MAG: hypothetical protein E6R00_12150 [Gammaproteobacteria bacterium]GAD48327.1 hypothetical protein NT2_02_04090 [Caenibius tardaugens NBRC 16725]